MVQKYKFLVILYHKIGHSVSYILIPQKCLVVSLIKIMFRCDGILRCASISCFQVVSK